jgi:multicomponent Na+:H+ antiporter subunit G
MSNILIGFFATIGSLFVLTAAIGILKMPDFYTRLSVTVKAATLGIGCILLAAAFYFYDFSVTSKVIAIIFFLFITAPVAGHMISRAAYFSDTPLWKNTTIDELKGKYDKKTHKLKSDIEQNSGIDMEDENEHHI